LLLQFLLNNYVFGIWCSKSFICELTGDLVEEFRKGVMSSSGGFPIIVLQFVKIVIVQG
jgi:hypothetical protein